MIFWLCWWAFLPRCRPVQLQRKVASSFITVSTVALPVDGQPTMVRPEVLQQYGLDQQTVSGWGGDSEWVGWGCEWVWWGQGVGGVGHEWVWWGEAFYVRTYVCLWVHVFMCVYVAVDRCVSFTLYLVSAEVLHVGIHPPSPSPLSTLTEAQDRGPPLPSQGSTARH